MKKNAIVLLAAACLLFINTFPTPADAGHGFNKRFLCKNKVKVMTRNLYLGADIFKVRATVSPAILTNLSVTRMPNLRSVSILSS